MPGPSLVARDAEKKGSLVSLELVLLLVLTVAAGSLLWAVVSGTVDRAETDATGYEVGLEGLEGGF